MNARAVLAALPTFLFTAAWLVLAALADAWLLERWYGVNARKPLHYPELAVNALLLAVPAALVVLAVHALVSRRLAARAIATDLVVGGVTLAGAGGLYFVRFAGEALGEPGLSAVALILAGLAVVGVALAMRRSRAAKALVRVVLGLVLAGALLGEALRMPLALARAARGAHSDAPSVVLIVIDTLRADHLSCHGYPVSTSPEIDALAARGVRFSRAYANASWTLPATASIHTGRLPSSHSATARGRVLPASVRTIAECLADAGYRRAAFSENQIVSPRYGFDQGFELFWSYWLPWISGQTATYRVARALGVPLVELVSRREYHPRVLEAPELLNWDAKRTTDEALRWMHASARGDAPFFLYLHYMGPHGPYGPPEFLLDVPSPARRVANHPEEAGGAHPLGPAGTPLPANELDELRTLYDADIRYVDREVGRVVAALDRMGRLDETLVVVTSDHGEEFFEHGGWNHGRSVYEEIVHIPLIVSGAPLGAVRGETLDAPVRQIDVLPTLLDAVGAETPEEVHGRSLWGAITDGEPGDGRDARDEGAGMVYVEGCFLQPEGFDGQALVDFPWKLVTVSGDDTTTTRLFDLAMDPGEIVDATHTAPSMADSLHRESFRWARVASLFDPEARSVRLDPETVEALRRLGYLQ